MLEIVYYVASSLDGYIATPVGGLEWLADLEAGNEDYGYLEFYESVDAVLLGARTYEQSLTFTPWPYPEKPVWVFSSRRLEASGPDVTVTDRSPAQIVTELKARGMRRVWLVGGGEIASSFRAAGLITEYIVSIIPVILGSGIPVLGGSGTQQMLRLLATESYPTGVLQLRYAPAASGYRAACVAQAHHDRRGSTTGDEVTRHEHSKQQAAAAPPHPPRRDPA